MSLTHFLPSIDNKMEQLWSSWGQLFSDIAAVNELQIDKGDRHLIFKFSGTVFFT